ncbi:MAG: AAA family ATPase [Gammaproteobacteria bacterium]|nr:AAA family ATPase [Gammaproteobacteria bacterium]
MNEHLSTSPHSYVIAYGMSREPFGDGIEDDLFYAEPTRQQKLDILLHLTQYGNELMLVSGPEGSGKTTLLQQFQLHALDTWKVARIEAKNGLDERKLVQQLFHQMGLQFHGATHAELLEHLEHHFDSLQHSARQAVMLIDDAERLPVTALKCVLALAGLTSRDNKPLLRIVLFGTDKLDENLTDPLLEPHSAIVHHKIELPAFDSEQTTHYILHRLSAAHFADSKPFTDVALRKIHRQSRGWPGEINRLAHNLLVETAPTTSAATAGHRLASLNLPRTLATLIGITVISALLIFQGEFNAWLEHSNDAQTASRQQPLSLPDAASLPRNQTTTITADTAADIDTDPVLAPAPPAAPAEPDADQPTAIVEKIYGAKEPDATPAPEGDAAETEPPSPPLSVTTSPAPPPPTVPGAAPVLDSMAASTLAEPPPAPGAATVGPSTARPNLIPADLPGQRSDWIQAQDPGHYTLQLVAGNDIKTLRAFIQRHSPGEPLAVYQSTRNNRPWFGLIHGIFTDKQQAIDARARLPKGLRLQNPWVRSLRPLQQELNGTGLTP